MCLLDEALVLEEVVTLLPRKMRERQALELAVAGAEHDHLWSRARDELHIHSVVERSVLHHECLHLR